MKLREAQELVARTQRSFYMADGTLVRHTLLHLMDREGEPRWRQYFLNPTVSADDVLFVLCAFALIFLLRLALSGGTSGVFRRMPCVAKALARRLRWVRAGKLDKFGENVWYTIWHTTAFLWGLHVIWEERGNDEAPGWPRLHLSNPDGRWFWLASEEEHLRGSGGWPLLLPTERLRCYYLSQLGFWLSCVAFMNIEARRKDYVCLLTHHVVTIALVAFSYLCSYWKMGIVVLVLHDAADVFLYLSKSLHYSIVHPKAVETSFTLFVIIYFITRLIIFPIYCVMPCVNTPLIRELTHGYFESHWRIPGGIVLPIFLIVLLALHVYWFSLIVKMVVGLLTAIKNGSREGVEDVRSEDELSDAENQKTAKKEH